MNASMMTVMMMTMIMMLMWGWAMKMLVKVKPFEMVDLSQNNQQNQIYMQDEENMQALWPPVPQLSMG